MTDPLRLLDTLKTAAAALLSAEVPFAVAGGTAAYARGAAPPFHDIDLVIMESDVPAAVKALSGVGMRIEDPPEDWLIKAFDDDRMVDLIYRLAGAPVTRELLARADELDVAAIRMPVLDATDLVVSWLNSFSEHHADFGGTVTCVRPLREQADWDAVRAATAGSPFARAFLVLLEELNVL